MMASFRAKSARGMRSGDGREGRLGLEKATSVPPGRSKGEGTQAMAWQTMSFEKLDSSAKDKDTSNCSSSTSPETDPGASNVFPLFAEEDTAHDEGDDELGGGDDDGAGSASTGKDRAGKQRTDNARAAAKAKPAGYRNPMFHNANGNSETEVASLFPMKDEDGDNGKGSSQTAINGSNPMFKRSVSDDRPPRPKANPAPASADLARTGIARTASASSSGDDSAATKKGEGKDKEACEYAGQEGHEGDKGRQGKTVGRKKEKKPKAMYEHVGRINVRPFLADEADGENVQGVGHRGFRLDTFARNEGSDGRKAHFKFVFTLDGVVVPAEGEDSKKLRPVMDAIHERATGKLTVRCNDGRQVKAEESNAVDVAITHIGVVLFYPKTVSKGHHLYTLSLNGRTLFSVLA